MSRPQKKKAETSVTPMKFLTDLWAARISLTLIAAIQLDIFTAIAQGRKTAADVARAIKANTHGIERLLEALTSIGYLTKRGNLFALTPIADTYLVRTKPSFIGSMADEGLMTLEGWMKLANVIKTGKSVASIDSSEGREFFPHLVKAIFPLSYNSARALVRAIPESKLKKIERVLDVAAGSAAWSLPFAQAVSSARVTALDLPEVTAVTREYAQQFGLADRYDYLEGDLRQTDFGQKQYDIVILGHIIHTEGEKWGKILINKAYRALKPGGTLVIAEMIPNDSRTGPTFPLLFGLNMLLHTHEGDVFTMAEYKDWLKKAGFSTIKLVEVESPSPVILATR